MRLFSSRVPRSIARAWPLAGALMIAAAPAGAQDTTVVGSGGADSGVTVNMNVLDNGGGTAPRSTPRRSRGDGRQLQLTPPDQGQSRDTQGRSAEGSGDIGDRGPGPLGRVLLFPPMEHPQSRLTVDPEALAAQAERQRGETQQASAPQLREPGSDGGGQSRGTSSQTQQGQQGQPRESGMTAEGRAMAESAGSGGTTGQRADRGQATDGGGDGGTQGAASTGAVPDEPELPDAPGTAGASGNQPDPVTPESKPSPSKRDTGGTSMASNTGAATSGTVTGTDGDQQTAAAEAPDTGSTDERTGTGDMTAAEGETGQSGSMASTTTGDTGSGSDGMGETSQAAARDGDMADGDMADMDGETGTAGRDAAQSTDTQTTETQTADGQTAETQTADTGSGGTQSGTGASDATATGETQTGSGDGDGTDASETQTAKRTPAGDALPGKLQLDFETGSAKLSDSTRATLKDLAAKLKDNPDARIQLMAYAKGGDEGSSRARRLSLSRALAVRSFLIDRGVRSTRMDVRALGDTAKAGPLDRVDIVPASG